jgi:carbamate kinase
VRLVVALGGNALLRRGEPLTIEVQRSNVANAVRSLAPIAREHRLVVTHGNGPQVGLLALQAEAARTPRIPLDVLGAESQGMVGYLLEQAFESELPRRHAATLLTQVVVDRADPAFSRPTKPIGPTYGKEEAERLAADRGWTVAPDGPSYRRVVPSPEPKEIVELEAIRSLVDNDLLVICLGGGGVPVVLEGGSLRGVEAVVDKDLAAALLAITIDADMLALLTDVAFVEQDWGTEAAKPIERATPRELRAHEFAPGTMGPKVEAACRFVERTGKRAAIGAMQDAGRIVAGSVGTQVLPEPALREELPGEMRSSEARAFGVALAPAVGTEAVTASCLRCSSVTETDVSAF